MFLGWVVYNGLLFSWKKRVGGWKWATFFLKKGWVVENGLLFSWKKGWVGGFCTTFFLNHHCVANYVLGIPMVYMLIFSICWHSSSLASSIVLKRSSSFSIARALASHWASYAINALSNKKSAITSSTINFCVFSGSCSLIKTFSRLYVHPSKKLKFSNSAYNV